MYLLPIGDHRVTTVRLRCIYKMLLIVFGQYPLIGHWLWPGKTILAYREKSLFLLVYVYRSIKNLFHFAIFQKFFSYFLKYINGLCFTIHVIKFSSHFVSINRINV